MRKLLLSLLFLLVLLALPLLALRSERFLLMTAYWAVETFTDLRLVLVDPVVRPFKSQVSASEIHLYPDTDNSPPFISILKFRSDINVQNLYWGTLRDSTLEAEQVTIFTSERDNVEDPEPVQWLKQLTWLPAQLEVAQVHVVNASREIFIFPLADLRGQRMDGGRFWATAKAQYEGEPLAMELNLSAGRNEIEGGTVSMQGKFISPVSGSELVLDGSITGTRETFEYNFELEANYADINEIMRGFKKTSNLSGALRVSAKMNGDTEGYHLSDARFILDNMPSYGVEAAGTMSVDHSTEGGQFELIVAGEVSSIDAALNWPELNLDPLGRAQGSAVLSGTIEKPMVDQFVLRSESPEGLQVSVSGKFDPNELRATDNQVKVDIQGPSLSVLEHWTGPLPFGESEFAAAGRVVGMEDRIALKDMIVHVGDRTTVTLRLDGDADDLRGLQDSGLSGVEGIALKLSLYSPDSEHLTQYLDQPVPGGFEIDGNVSLEGNGSRLQVIDGKLQLSSSDIQVELIPESTVIQPTQAPVIASAVVGMKLQASDTSALSQYLPYAVPVLGPLEFSGKLVQQEQQVKASDIAFEVDGEELRIAGKGSIGNLSPLDDLKLNTSFSGVQLRSLLLTFIDRYSYSAPLGTLSGSTELGMKNGAWSLSNLEIFGGEESGPVELRISGSALITDELKTGDIVADYNIRDPGLLEALTRLPMNPVQGRFTSSSANDTIDISNELSVGATKLSTQAQIEHNQEAITSLRVATRSPLLYLDDLGLQGGSGPDPGYVPAEQLEDIAPNTTLEKTLQTSPRFAMDFSLGVDGIVGENTNIRSLDVHFTGVDKRYTLRKFNVGYAESLGEIRGIIDLNASPPCVSLAGEAEVIPLATLGKDIGLNTEVTGELTIRGGLSAQGSSGPEIMGALNGSLALALENATVEGAAYDVLATDLLAWFYSGAALEKSTKIDCTMAQFQLRDGIATSHSVYIETPKMVATGKAKLNMANSTMDIRITPRSKSRALQVPSEVRLKGDFSDPKAEISPVTAAVNAYVEVLALVPTLARKIFGIKREVKGTRPCEAKL